MNADKIGIIAFLADKYEMGKIANLGAKWVRLTLQQFVAEWNGPGQYNWAQFDESVNAARALGLEIYASIIGAPKWEAPDITPSPDGWVAIQPKERIPVLQAYVEQLCVRYKDIRFWGIETEVNIPGRAPFRNDGQGFWKMTPEEFATNVILPCAEVIHGHGKKVVAPGITIQRFDKFDDGSSKFDLAVDYFKRIRVITKRAKAIDHYAIHAYGKNVKRVHEGIKDFMEAVSIQNVWVTETGVDELWHWTADDVFESIVTFTMRNTEELQLRHYKYLIPTLLSDPSINKVFLYKSKDDDKGGHKSTAGLLKRYKTQGELKLKAKLAGIYMQGEWNK